MNVRTLAAPILGSLVAVLVLSAPGSSAAQSPFVQDDAYDFRGNHAFWLSGTGPDDFTIGINSDTDFRKFKLRVRTGAHISSYWFVERIKVDMNNDGTWELETTAPEAVASYTYPEPSGLSATHTVRFEIRFVNIGGAAQTRTAYSTVTIFPAPRVFATAENDAFIQVRNEDPTNKIPILVVEGFDPLNDKFPEWYYVLVWDLVNGDLYPAGFEVFLLDFSDGGGDIRDNADVVLRALEKIHEICPNSEIALFGLSMGGPISRYALAKSENDGDAHQVGLFVSFDSPQQMAHANPDLQDWIAGENPNEGAIGHLQQAINSVAAKQMLGYNTYDPQHVFHEEFYNELDALNGDGYPHRSFNAAISNGNFEAKWGYESVGRHLMTLRINNFLVKDVPAVQLDCGTGGLMSDLTMRRYGDIFNNPLIHVYYVLEIIFNPTYIPTFSALDLQGFDIDPISGDITSYTSSKFDDFAVQDSTIMHHELTPTTRSKILSWLNRTSNFNVNYTLQEGGTTSPETFPVTILRNTPITIPPKDVTVNGVPVTYNFGNWDDGDTQNPRYFYASHDMTRTVRLKGHRVTTSPGATWASNARRITVDSDWTGPTYHAVYESGGTIWHLRNRRNAGWEPERPVSVGYGTASNPTITTHSWGHEDQIQVYVAWIEDGYVWFRASNIDNGLTWQDVRDIPSGMGSSVILPDPYGVIWAEGYPGYEGIYYYKMPLTNDTWEPHRIPGTEGSSSSPAACAASGCRYELAFIRDGGVYVEGFSDPDPLNGWVPPTVCSPAVDLTSPGWTASNPTIVNNDGTICVAWEETDQTSRRIAYRERSGSTWSPTRYFMHSSHLVAKPVLAIDWGCGTVNLLWECDGSVARVTRPRTGTVWAGIEHIGVGRAPSIVASSSHKTIPMWVSGAGAPYSIQTAGSLACTSSGGGGGGGCPILYAHGAKGWSQENSILGRSRDGRFLTDAYRVRTRIKPEDGSYRLMIREDEKERTTLDHVGFRALERDSKHHSWSMDGQLVLGRLHPPIRVTTDGGKDLTSQLDGSSPGSKYLGNPGDVLEFELPSTPPGDGGSGTDRVVLVSSYRKIPVQPVDPTGMARTYDEEVLEETGLMLEYQDETGAWRTTARQYPREKQDLLAFEVPVASRYRLVFAGRHSVVSIAYSDGSVAARGESHALLAATHTRLGDVTAALQRVDGDVVELRPGERIELSFQAPDAAVSETQDFFLEATGVYTSLEETGAHLSQRSSMPDEVPGVSRLLQNRPNPFGNRTEIAFALAKQSQVRIDVFDLQGRVVATVVDRVFPAGTHTVTWDRLASGRHRVPAGVYFYRIDAGSLQAVRKMLLLP